MIRRVWAFRALVFSLIRRQFHIRYRQSFVGIAWAFVPPLATLGAGTLVFHRVVGVETGNTEYPVFALAALVPWTFFANSVMFGVNSVSDALVLVTRMSFPRAVLPLSVIGVSLVDLSVSVGIFVIFVYLMGEGLQITALWVPILLLLELLLVTGVVLLGSAINIFARDVRLAVPLVVQLWLFLTPVMYPLSDVPSSLRLWFLVNPMTGLVESFRSVLVYGNSPHFRTILPALIGALVALTAGWWYFRATEPRFADVI